MAFLLGTPALLSCSLACLVVRLVAPLVVGFVEASLGVAFGDAVGLAEASGFLEAAWLSLRVSRHFPPLFLQSFSILGWSASHVKIWLFRATSALKCQFAVRWKIWPS